MPFSRAAACLLPLLLSSLAFPSPIDLIPKSSPMAVWISISGDDEGMSWFAGRLKSYLLSRYSGKERIEDFTFLDVDELAFGVFPQKSGTHAFVLVARLVDRGEPMRIKTGKHDIKIHIRDKDTARRFKRSVLVSLLELLVEESSESTEKVSSPRGDIEIAVKASSYSFLGENVVVGASREAVGACRTAFASKEERISATQAYGDIRSRLSSAPSDLRVFVDNGGDDFKRYVVLCRADWGPSLLSMAESVDYLGVAVDIINGESMRARIVTHSPDKVRARATQATVEANLPLFLKKYLGEEVDHKIEMGHDGLYVIIDLDVRGLSGYWDGLFEVEDRDSDG